MTDEFHFKLPSILSDFTQLRTKWVIIRHKKGAPIRSVVNHLLCRNNSMKIILKNLSRAENPLTFAT